MATGNAINLNSAGVVSYNGAGTFTGSAITQHNVLTGGASNAISSVAPGASGNVLTSDGTDWVSSSFSASSLKTATLQLTSLQVKNLHATPITIVSAPGANKILVPVGLVGAAFNFVSVFGAAASQTISLAYRGGGSLLTAVNNSQLVSAFSSFLWNGAAAVDQITFANCVNLDLVMYNPVATEINGNNTNDNTINIFLTYYVMSSI